MTTGGWIFMSISLTFVWSLAIWSYRRVLTSPEPTDQDQGHP